MKDTQAQALQILLEHQAILQNTHVVYTSGDHGSAYVNKDAVYTNPNAVSQLCRFFAEHFQAARPEVVAAPAVGGVILSQWTAWHLYQLGIPAQSVYAEKEEPKETPQNGQRPPVTFAFRRGYGDLIRGKRVLVVEDVLTTGGSLKAAIAAVRRAEGIVVGAGALCNRGRVTLAEMDDPPELYALTEFELETWKAADCPLCKQGVPVNVDVGKGRAFVENQG